MDVTADLDTVTVTHEGVLIATHVRHCAHQGSATASAGSPDQARDADWSHEEYLAGSCPVKASNAKPPERRHGSRPRASMILTSNLTFARGGDVFGDLTIAWAMVDRIVHHAGVISLKGNSYRLKKHQPTAGTAQ